MTYSILAHDVRSGQLGVAVQSHYFGVGRSVPWGQAGVGVVATQSVVDPRYGEVGLRLLADGAAPSEALRRLCASDDLREARQVAVMDATGANAAHTGRECVAAAGHHGAPHIATQANLVASPEVWKVMAETFEATEGDELAERLLAALFAAEAAGGDIRGQMSASLLVVADRAGGGPQQERPVDIRVDWSENPLQDLAFLLSRGRALDAVGRIAGQPGLMRGPMTAGPEEVDRALQELEAVQLLVGPSNPEPAVWSSLLLARANRPADAAAVLATASASGREVAEIVRRLAETEVWTGGPQDLEALLHAVPRTT